MNNIEDLLNFLLEIPWIKDKGEQLNHNTRLEEDLHIYGDYAEEFLFEYSDVFSVDISNFNFAKYFTKESFWGYHFIAKRFCRNKKTDTLTIGDLEKGILAGRLDDDVLARKVE